jgi:hypothetical protein
MMKCCEDCVFRFACESDDFEEYCATREAEFKKELLEEKLGKIR